MDVLPELGPLPVLRVHLQRVDLLRRLLNKAGNTGKTKAKKKKRFQVFQTVFSLNVVWKITDDADATCTLHL